jgi:3-hydroxybutyryl-CoA dehydrogenase
MVNLVKIGVVGAGQMGAGIAQVCAQAGYEVFLWDSNPEGLSRGFQLISKLLSKGVEKGKIDKQEAEATMSRLARAGGMGDFSECDMVIEAVVENTEVKCGLLSELDSILKKDAILASNTSSISITRLAAATTRPDKVVGIHFMNPVPVMKLVELIRGLQTSDETYNYAVRLVEALGKVSILGVDTPGFVVNRILCPMINEAIFLLQQGVRPEDIDNGMKLGTNQPMGPLELADFVGLDTLLYILQLLHRELGEDKYRPCPLLINYVAAGWYGKKAGRGFYDYRG